MLLASAVWKTCKFGYIPLKLIILTKTRKINFRLRKDPTEEPSPLPSSPQSSLSFSWWEQHSTLSWEQDLFQDSAPEWLTLLTNALICRNLHKCKPTQPLYLKFIRCFSLLRGTLNMESLAKEFFFKLAVIKYQPNLSLSYHWCPGPRFTKLTTFNCSRTLHWKSVSQRPSFNVGESHPWSFY